MSNVTITSLSSPNANITINDSYNTSTSISSTGGETTVVTINQGTPGPPGPPGTGILNIGNYGSNRLLTSDGSSYGINAESSLQYNGSILSISGIPVSISGHNHIASDITNFNTSVSGILPVKDIISGSGISVSSASGIYTISATTSNLTISSNTLNDNGRLTLLSGDPLNIGNLSGSTIYYTPYLGNYISLYNTSNNSWESHLFNELSLVLSSMTINTNYDIFIYNSGPSLSLEKIAWSNNTTRSINIIYQDGVLVKSGSLNKRYVGTIRATSATTTEDSSSKRFVFNANNRMPKILSASDTTTHTYTLSTIRPYRNITTGGLTRAEFIIGLANHPIDLICHSVFATETNTSSVGLSIDSISAFNTSAINSTYISSGPALVLYNTSADYITNISSGYHYVQLLQSGSSITTFYNSSLKIIILC